ncbi:MAG TPA: four helix bundle protein [Candidatus Paceibacterota bacterium]|nr:four helix bundle protein [Candidatus Paceibacterota bacterium]
MSTYRELTVWQKSLDLVVLVYRFTQKFPVQEQYGLTSQMRRAAVSIPSNIAEGSRRRGKDIRHFLVIAFASGSELETQFEVSKRLEYGDKVLRNEAGSLLDEVMRMLNKMINS